MADVFRSTEPGLADPAFRHFTITPGASDFAQTCRAVYVNVFAMSSTCALISRSAIGLSFRESCKLLDCFDQASIPQALIRISILCIPQRQIALSL